MRWKIETLTFDLVDDICLGLQSGTITEADLPTVNADGMGPLLELRHTQPNILSRDGGSLWLSADNYRELMSNMREADAWFEPRSGHQGFISVETLRRDELAWTGFVLRAKRAAISAGFSEDYGGKQMAAIGEFYANVIDHSGRIDSGYVVYSASPGRFEFVVADGGIGVLNSLRSNPAYAHLVDAGTALELALDEGVSRYYTEQGHGFGFRPLFVGLANISRYMRFRSDDHSRSLTRKADGSIDAQTSQLATTNGFFCCVVCDVEIQTPASHPHQAPKNAERE
ncbi:hypothetical protein NL532_23010 [Mesorhizobium sp. C120A]|uniref:hypothetical protein n=1 Tax=unclassified Mesorhizobium TaxID=325217 RepID=UPI0003CF9DC7|nr:MULTISPECIES: hypothetical protein [unclassified Mesorhizobium]ESZ61462.1 hypothetical protein X728_14025 [Mesorhizobium sp. L103C120A0]WJI43486.1 hypothetical protein NL532_23010 [Mesorhizobium sp. C120A]